jgi:hypothetical protein
VNGVIQNIISEKYANQLVFAKNDVLVHIADDKSLTLTKNVFTFGESSTVQIKTPSCIKLVNAAKENLKLHGVNTLCVLFNSLDWKQNDEILKSPLFLIPVIVTHIKNTDYHSFEPLWDETFINPFLLQEVIPETLADFEKSNDGIINFIRSFQHYVVSLNSEWDIKNTLVLANAHPDRFDRLRELNALQKTSEFSDSLKQLLGIKDKQIKEVQVLSNFVLPCDPSQENAIQNALSKNIALIGPPGTGKSQVLVNSIAEVVTKKQITLVTSEKQDALLVIQKRFEEIGMGTLCHVFEAHKTNTHFITSLQKSWNFIEALHPERITLLQQGQRLQNQLQTTLDQLQHPTFAMGVDYTSYLNLTRESSLKDTSSPFVPDLKQWSLQKPIIQNIYSKNIALKIGSISASVLQQTVHYPEIIQRLMRLEKESDLLPNFEKLTLNELTMKMKLSVLCSHFVSHEIGIDKGLFITQSILQKRFFSLRKKKLAVLKSLEVFVNDPRYTQPITQLEVELDLLKHPIEDKGLRQFFNFRKTKKGVNPDSKNQVIISQLTDFLSITEQGREIDQKLMELGIESSAAMESVYFFINLLETDPSKDNFFSLSFNQKKEIAAQGKLLGSIYHEIKQLIRVEGEAPLKNLIKEAREALEVVALHMIDIDGIGSETIKLLRKCTTFESLNSLIINSNRIKFESLYPHLANWNNSTLQLKLIQIAEEKAKDNQLVVQQILQQQRATFYAYQHLLTTPGAQLNTIQKELKQQLRKGKSILVKEFAKKRSHAQLKELLLSDALPWIKLLKPILMGNPSHIAQQIPLTCNWASTGFIDEGSQMLLSHALPFAQRCEKLIIAGDPQQMTPSFFFQKTVDEVDVLHQAIHYFDKQNLTFHYRSEHPALLEFSNHFFYNNELIPIKKSKSKEVPIRLIYCEDGIYENRSNVVEATQMSNLLQKNNSNESIGLVAFSEIQLETIISHLGASSELFSEDYIQNFARSIEQIQGDECDHLFISLGYGKNLEGKLKLNFGMLNKQNGARRLNVLFSRAKKSITLLHSVKPEDLELSTNEGVNMLRWYLKRYQEKQQWNSSETIQLNENNAGELLLSLL